MSNGNSNWTDPEKKSDAVYKVLKHLAEHPEDGTPCVGNDANAHALFKQYGGIEVPPGARVCIFAAGEKALKHRGSVILEIPSGVFANARNQQLKRFVLGNYRYWHPQAVRRRKPRR